MPDFGFTGWRLWVQLASCSLSVRGSYAQWVDGESVGTKHPSRAARALSGQVLHRRALRADEPTVHRRSACIDSEHESKKPAERFPRKRVE